MNLFSNFLFQNSSKKKSLASPLKTFQKHLKKLIVIDDSQIAGLNDSTKQTKSKRTKATPFNDTLTASTPLKSNLLDTEAAMIESSISSAIDNVMNNTLCSPAPQTIANENLDSVPTSKGTLLKSGKKKLIKKGRKSVLLEPVEPKSKLKSSIDFDENTNDMLYSEDQNNQINDSDEEQQITVVTKKEQKLKLKEEKDQQRLIMKQSQVCKMISVYSMMNKRLIFYYYDSKQNLWIRKFITN